MEKNIDVTHIDDETRVVEKMKGIPLPTVPIISVESIIIELMLDELCGSTLTNQKRVDLLQAFREKANRVISLQKLEYELRAGNSGRTFISPEGKKIDITSPDGSGLKFTRRVTELHPE